MVFLTGEPEADELLERSGTALLIGMLLDQQVSMTSAFVAPARLRDRLGHLDATTIAASPLDVVVAACRQPPAVHRFPTSMGRRIHALCTVLADRYGGDGARVWSDVRSGHELLERLRDLPGFGDEKSRIFVALLAKRYRVRPRGWRAAAGVFADAEPRTIADVDSPEALARVRAWKQAQRAAGLDKQGRPATREPRDDGPDDGR